MAWGRRYRSSFAQIACGCAPPGASSGCARLAPGQSGCQAAAGLHCFVEKRLLAACGVAAKFSSCCCPLFPLVFGNAEDAADKIFELVTTCGDAFCTSAEVESIGLLCL